MVNKTKILNKNCTKSQFSLLHAFPTSVPKSTGESSSFQLPRSKTLNPVFYMQLRSQATFFFKPKIRSPDEGQWMTLQEKQKENSRSTKPRLATDLLGYTSNRYCWLHNTSVSKCCLDNIQFNLSHRNQLQGQYPI